MPATARAVTLLVLFLTPLPGIAQTGPSDPQVISAAPTAKLNVGARKLAGHVVATLRVGEDGRVKDLLVTENTAEPSFESQVVRVLQSARFRPAIDASGRPVEGSVEMKVELRQSTGAEPKPVSVKPDSERADAEKARILRMRCVDFIWEWDLIREEANNSVVTEFMPRIATAIYATMRSEAGEYVDSKVWKASAKVLRTAADSCRENPQATFWQDTFKPIMDEAVAD
jgi:hypothetical protein